MLPKLSRSILALDDEQLEELILKWIYNHSEYDSVESFRGTGDKGRDVVGFYSKLKHEGEWDNYQCKQYGSPLNSTNVIREIGKMLYYSYQGEFSLPKSYYFIAPRGLNREAEKLLFNPQIFKETILNEWDNKCRKNIIKTKEICLGKDLIKHINKYDFSTIFRINLDKLLMSAGIKAVLHKDFGVELDAPPQGNVPQAVQDIELPYIGQLLDVYGERDKCIYCQDEATDHLVHGEHLREQRERFFHADAFERHFRDNSFQDDLGLLRGEVYSGVKDVHKKTYTDGLERLGAVMAQAAVANPTSPLAKYAQIQVKQGLCHHFANEGTLKWKK